jgi:hypothetical protein
LVATFSNLQGGRVQPSEVPSLHLAELVARTARELGIETAVIGALALAAHNYIRGTNDVDLATSVAFTSELRRLADKLAALGCKIELRLPDEDDPLGGVLEVWLAMRRCSRRAPLCDTSVSRISLP